MAKIASPRTRNLLVVAILIPLWASYLVKVYAWRVILQRRASSTGLLSPFGLSGPGLRERRHVARLHVSLAAVHDPPGLRRARADPAARCSRPPRTSARAAAGRSGSSSRSPSRARGRLDLHVLADARRLHHAGARLEHAVHRQRRLHNVGVANNLPFAAAFATVPVAVMVLYLLLAGASGRSRTCDVSGRHAWLLRGRDAADARFIYIPLLVICLYAFNERRSLSGRSRS